MPWVFENNKNNTNHVKKHTCAKHCSKCFQTLWFISSLQSPNDVGSIINSFTDEEFEVKRCLLIMIKIMKLRGEFESKPRKFTHLNTAKLHWGLLWWFSSKEIQSEIRSIMPNSLGAHGLYNPWNSPDQNTGVCSLSLSPGDLPKPGIEPRSPTLQVDSLPAEPQGKP